MEKDDLIDMLELALDQLKQYRDYSEDMRKIGRGMYVLSPISTDHLITCLESVLKQESA